MSTASNRVILLEEILTRLLFVLDQSEIIEANIDELLMNEFEEVVGMARKALSEEE